MNISSIYEGLFEAHITVKPFDHSQQKEIFDQLCHSLGIKAIQIELSRGDVPIQPMTCSRHTGNLSSVYQQVLAIAEKLGNHQFEVTRLKIEAHPDNVGVPQTKAELSDHSKNNYFEHHLKILLDSQSPPKALLEVCQQHVAHLSNNAYKSQKNGQFEYFVTKRLYHTAKIKALQSFTAFAHDLQQTGIEVLKSITEYCVYDSNVNIDDNWLEEASPCATCHTFCS